MSKKLFQQVEMPKNPRSTFDLSHDIKQTFSMGELVPNVLIETLPGDNFRIQTNMFSRFLPMVAPPMHRCSLTQHFFFVPYRILSDTWEDFITNEDVPSPFHNSGSSATILNSRGTIGDYLGLPIADLNIDDISSAPLSAYNKIYNEYYRDQNLQTEIKDSFLTTEFGAGLNAVFSNTIGYRAQPYKRAWSHDYFTSCLPFAQKGGEVELPILNDEAVEVILSGSTNSGLWRDDATDALVGPGSVESAGSGGQATLDAPLGNYIKYDPNGTLQADFTGEVQTIRTLRRAFKLQEWLERNARGGTRYIEMILAHFGTKSSDQRLQRPEYIGGTKQRVDFSEVLSTNETTTLSLGQMGGHGISLASSDQIKCYTEEHGLIMGICSIMPEADYAQGLHRMHNRKDPTDYYWPSFANIGEQEVLNQEIFYDNADGLNKETFGYIPRYAEYKYQQNKLAGLLRPGAALDFWTLAQEYATRPALNSDFIECDPSTRIFADEEAGDHLLLHMHSKITAKREMPYFGSPMM